MTASQLYRWARSQPTEMGLTAANWLDGQGKRSGFPARICDWDADQVQLGHRWAVEHLERIRVREIERAALGLAPVGEMARCLDPLA